MKSVLITFLMFAVALGAMYAGVFNIMSSGYIYLLAGIVLFVVFIFAFKVLGNPFAKDVKHGKKKH